MRMKERVVKVLVLVLLVAQAFSVPAFAWDSAADGAVSKTHPDLVQQGYNILMHDLSEADRSNGPLMAVLNDFGTYMGDFRQGSVAPDFNDKLYTLYQDHFYDPYTKENFTSLNNSISTRVLDYVFFTAMHRSKDQVAVALGQYKRGQVQAAIYTFGKAMHYYSDMCQPHHASNAIGGTEESTTKHSAFETFSNQVLLTNKLQSAGVTTDQPFYQDVLQSTYIADFIQADGDQNAMVGQGLYKNIFRPSDSSTWTQTARVALEQNQKTVAKMIYRFAKEIVNPNSEATRVYDNAVNLSIRVRTTSGSIFKGYGTDNDVFFGVELKNGKIEEWKLDKSGYNDFENGDNDTYNVTLNGSVGSEIRKTWIRKQRGWQAGSFEDNWHVSEVEVHSADGQFNHIANLNRWIKGNSKVDILQ